MKDLARSVGVNVLANLIAAAIIYLGGALFGLFPRSTEGIVVASGSLLLAAFIALWIFAQFLAWPRKAQAYAVCFCLVGSALLITGLAGIQVEAVIPLWGQIVWGVLSIGTGVTLGWMLAARRL